ncbi:MAG: peptidoglycan bridge formation glycyltransferase FemA/FemB family protein [Anaerolineaceae bacterium]|nr:peptidoglycan bridge formation glycyltransferase FemA/FemB family protein [Anaerolineaceae bacterium]
MKFLKNYEIIDVNTWNKCIEIFNDAHFLQSSLWADVKRENGWEPFYLLWKDLQGNIMAGAMVLERTVKILSLISAKVHYCPKGPMLNTRDYEGISEVILGLQIFSRNRKGIFIKIDPDLVTEMQVERIEDYSFLNFDPNFPDLLRKNNWIESKEQIQFRNTIVISLEKTDEEILKDMKQKTRYNIRLSERKGVKVRIGDESDFEELFKLFAETALRDNFVIRSKSYYLNLWKKFFDKKLCEPIIAELDGEILAAVIIYFFSGKAYYVYGMSSEKNRNLMATYLLQWKAIQRARKKNCKIYDFWGAPDELNENDRMWGVYKFKLGFGGTFIKTVGAWDFPVNKIGYLIYHFVLPKLLNVMRKIGFRKTQSEIE